MQPDPLRGAPHAVQIRLLLRHDWVGAMAGHHARRLAKPHRQSGVPVLGILASEALGDQQEAGDDYWVDPALASQEIEAERREQMRVEKFAKKKNAFKQAKLKEEIVAPYKANVIVYLVVGIGVIGTLFALFPQLLETPTLNMGATFPGDL